MALYRILMVDDDEEAILPAIAVLTGAGYLVQSAKDGWDGLAKARTMKPDLVLLDVRMPQMDGWTFMKFIRAHRDLAAIPVIFLTAAGSASDRARGSRLGADGYWIKPVDPNSLLSRVAAVLDRRSTAAPPPAVDPALSADWEELRMSGRIDQMGLLSLLSLLGAGQRTGVVELLRGPAGARGRIVLVQGRISSVRVEGVRRAAGLEALETLGKWREGAFSFRERETASAEDPAAAVPRF